MTDEIATSETRRFYLKHHAEPSVYAVEVAPDGLIINALDLSDEHTKDGGAGICKHALDALPLHGHVEDIERLNNNRNDWRTYDPDCRNVHHLVDELMDLEREYLKDLGTYNDSAEDTKALRKRADASGERVHALLQRLSTREPLPLFD